jgi:hypothetical protein
MREDGVSDERERCIDATVASAQGGGDAIGTTRRGQGVKLLAIVARQGLPVSVSTQAANHHAVTLGQLSVDFSMLEAKPEPRIGARAYDSEGLDAALTHEGVNLIAPPGPPGTSRRKMAAIGDAPNAAGLSNGSVRGSNGSGGGWFAGSPTSPTSWVLCSSHRSPCS